MIDRIKENPKTSVAGVSVGIASIIARFGYDVDPAIIASILTVIVVISGLFAKDK